MNYLNVVIGSSLAVWVLIGIRMHASWIMNAFLSEIEKIDFQQYEIENNGYNSISVDKNLKPQKLVVYGYWGNLDESLEDQKKKKRSPIVFRLVNASLISFTAIFVLIICSKGFFSSIGVY
tara:strand:- start:471 stop:833 length:363 start_codon:yes stop_codon:yes gene_type:complete